MTTPIKHCAFLTLDEQGDFVIDDEHAIKPLECLGWKVSTVSWRQTRVPWSDFDIVIIRSTWDYWDDPATFLSTLEEIDRQTLLLNSLQQVKWNIRKTYLRDLAEEHDIGVVPTLWADTLEPDSFASFATRLGTDELVVKPVVGANGEDAYRVSAASPARDLGHIIGRFQQRACMIQPFMSRVVSEGEYSLFFFNGQYSHAILKVPASHEFRSQEEHGAKIRSCDPEPLLLERAQLVIMALDEVPLYARADFVRDENNDFLVMEVELIEPSLYLRTQSEAAGRFASAIDQRVKEG